MKSKIRLPQKEILSGKGKREEREVTLKKGEKKKRMAAPFC